MSMGKPISIIFAGTPEFACRALEALIEDKRFSIDMVITQPDKPVGRNLKTTSCPVKQVATKNNILVQQPEKIASIKDKIESIKPDFIVVIAYGQILPQDILSIPRHGSVNVHGSILPKYRGASPIQEALRNGDSETGVSLQLMNKFLDQGDILEQFKLSIKDSDNYLLLSEKLSKLTAEKLPSVLVDFFEQKITTMKQDNSSATYCKKISKEDGLLDFNLEDAVSLVNKVRAFTPWPSCYTFLNKKRIKIVSATHSEQKINTGEWALTSPKQLGIGTKKGAFIPLILQPEGKKPMSAEEFVRGYFKG
ncbi:MAG: methionyl-tRNA formyltransferase [Patescibacteria group bacterium]